jgi:tRNA-binding protein
LKPLCAIEDFLPLDIRIGTVVSVDRNEHALRPAYVLRIDFGNELGTKIASAQITEHHSSEDLLGSQVMALTNLPAKRVARVPS